MKLSRFCLGLLLAGLLLSPFFSPPACPANPPARQRILMDADWRFQYVVSPVLSNIIPIHTWRWRVGTPAEMPQMTTAGLDPSGADWKDTASGPDIFGGRVGFAWYKATLPALVSPHRFLHFASVDDNATVYLNGHQLLHHEGWNDPFDVPLDAAWNATGPNELTVLVENTDGPGGIAGPVTLGTVTHVNAADPTRPAYDDHAWRVVHLPHDYVLESAFTPQGDPGHGSLIPTPAWYRKTFTLPASDRGKALWIDFDGAYRESSVWLNGRLLGTHPCGYTPFRFDISGAARYGGKNVLTVQVNPQREEGWWYEGGGIYRHVWLNVAAPVHVAPWGTFITSEVQSADAAGRIPAVVTVKSTFANAGAFAASCRVAYLVYNPNGQVVTGVVAQSATVPGNGESEMAARIPVPNAHLWSIETPQLYRLHTEIMQNGRIVDTQDTPFGIRTIRFDADNGFFLNGKSVKIKGTCNHQDFAGVGVAMPDSLLYWRIKKLKEMGSNAYRCSHNPPTAELLDACDKLGMIVMDENRHLGDTEDGKASQSTPYADLHEVQTMILRDRNHPSIIMWSMCNEEGIQSTPHGRDIFAAMKKVVDAADGTRPVTCAMNGGYDSAVGITSVEDLQGINYNPGAYDWFHKAHPAMALYGSETGSAVSTRGQYANDPVKGYVSNYDQRGGGWANTAQDGWQPIAERPFVAGGYVWTGFDYKGEPTPYGWPCINSHFGIMDECGFPKDSYYYYQAWWGGSPTVHLFPHWNWAGKEGQPINVWCYGNAARVELFLNGRSLGAKDMPRYRHAEWDVPYAPGRLEARGYDAQGRLFATDKVETTGAPAALRLTTDRTTLTPDGEDVTMVAVSVVDAQGRVVPTADNEISFALTGAAHIAGVGNGDPSSHEPDKASRRQAFNGHCLVIVGANETPGPVQLTASSPGLKAAAMSLVSQEK